MHRSAPEIRTERLRLRGHRRDDADAMIALWQDPVVMRHFGGEPMPAEDAWNRLLRNIGHWVANGYGMWVVEELATGTLVGNVGLFEGRRDIGAQFDAVPEAGWVLGPPAHGRGYAREAMRAALTWVEHEHDHARTVCMISPANDPSIRTAEALGYRPFGTAHYKGSEVLLFDRPRSAPLS